MKSRYHGKRPKANNASKIQKCVFDVIEEINTDHTINLASYHDHMKKYLDIAFIGCVFNKIYTIGLLFITFEQVIYKQSKRIQRIIRYFEPLIGYQGHQTSILLKMYGLH